MDGGRVGWAHDERDRRLRSLAFALVLALVAVVGLAAVSGVAAADAPTCTGTDADFAGGDGSAGTPYEITNAEQLQCLNHTAHLGAHAVLTSNVDASDTENWNGGNGFAPIGNDTNQFTGSFDGQGHTISNLTVNRSGENRVGLFGHVGASGSVSNVTVNGTITGATYVGGLAGWNDGTVTNSNASVTVGGDKRLGGLVGRNDGTIEQSYATGSVDGTFGFVGGLIGENFDGTVTKSFATGAVSGSATVGGLVGYNDQGDIDHSFATGSVDSEGRFVGGLVGDNDEGGIDRSFATGTVNGGSSVGGLVGQTDRGDISRSYATGSVTGDADVGGLVGVLASTIADSYWDEGTTGRSNAIGTVGTGGTVTNVNGFDSGDGSPAPEMTGAAAAGNMDALAFPDTWLVTGSYPALAWSVSGPSYTVTVEDRTSLDAPRDSFEVTVNVTNFGTAGGSQTITLTDTDFTDTVQDSAAVSDLDNGESTVLTLTWADSVDDDGDGVVTVASDNDTATITVWPYAGGDGSAANPYEIETWYHLDNARDHLDANYTLVADLDSTTAGYDDVASASANGNAGFAPLGDASTQFTGSLDGQGHTISNLTIDRSGESRVGLFGHVGTDGSVSNVGLANGSVTGSVHVGGLVGFNDGTVTNSSVAGTVTGDEEVGGLVGQNEGTLSVSSATGDSTATTRRVGGLVGWNGLGGTVANSSATATATGPATVGGLVGGNDGAVTDSYAAGTVSGDSDVGGLVGRDIGGPVTDSYWDVDATNQSTTASGGTGLTTVEMTGDRADDNLDGFDFGTTWTTTDGYPVLRWTVTDYRVTTGSTALAVGSTTQASANLTLVTGRTVGASSVSTFASDGATVAAVTGRTVTAQAIGTTTIRGTHAGTSDTVEVTVADATAPTADAGTDRTVDEGVQVDFDGSNSTDDVGVDSYAWDFDDGTTATGSQPSHTFADPGTYAVELTVTDAADNTDADTVTVTVEDVTDPTADASNSPTSGDEDSPIPFDGTASTDNGNIVSYEWDWTSDGNYDDTGSNPSHTYAAPGTYTVTLRVTDAADNTDTDSVTVTVDAVSPPNVGPTPETTVPTAVAGPDRTVAVNDTVSFDGSNSSDDGGVVTYEWEFGDGSPNATGPTPTHAYAQPGRYTVTLTVSDAAGNERTDSLVVTVADTTPPVADAGPNQTVDEDVAVNFDASATTDNVGIDSYEWSFGDGTTGTGQTTTHTYTQPGTYTVNLTVTDAAGNNATDALTVTVQESSSFALVNGEGSHDLDGDIARLAIVFADDGASGTVTVDSSDALPDDADALPDGSGLAFVDVTVPLSLTDSEATLRLTLDAAALGDIEPDDLVVYHYDGGEWTALETAVVSADGDVVLEATTPGFSLFAVAQAPQQTTPEETPTPDDETPTPDDETPTPDDETPTPGDDEESTGIGTVTLVSVLVIVVSVVSLGLVVARRRS